MKKELCLRANLDHIRICQGSIGTNKYIFELFQDFSEQILISDWLFKADFDLKIIKKAKW